MIDLELDVAIDYIQSRVITKSFFSVMFMHRTAPGREGIDGSKHCTFGRLCGINLTFLVQSLVFAVSGSRS